MSASAAIVLLNRLIKTPRVASFLGTLASDGSPAQVGLGVNTSIVLGSFTGGYRMLKAHPIIAVFTPNIVSAVDLTLYLGSDSQLPQDFFTQLVVQNGAGVPTTFQSANAASTGYFPAASSTFWNWGNGSSQLWVGADVGESKSGYLF